MAITLLEEPALNGSMNWSKNRIPVKLHTDLDPLTTKIVIILTIFKDDYSSYPVYLEETPDADGDVTFELNGMLDEAMDNDFSIEFPFPFITAISLSNGSPLEFFLDYFEYDNGVVNSSGSVNSFNNDDEKYVVMQGGIAPELEDKGVKYIESYFLPKDPLFPFLTWAPIKIYSDKIKPNILYYLNLIAVDSDLVKMKVLVYNDSTSVAGKITIPVSPVEKTNVLQCMAGWADLRIDTMLSDAAYTGPVTHWTIQLLNSADEYISELRTFYLDETYHKNKTYLIYQNSLNGFTDIMLTGETELKADNDRSVSRMVTPGSIITPRKTYSVHEDYGKKVNTAYLSPLEVQALRELLLSPRIYEMRPGKSAGINPQIYQIELTEKTKQLMKTNDYLHGIPIEYKYVLSSSVFTPDLSEFI